MCVWAAALQPSKFVAGEQCQQAAQGPKHSGTTAARAEAAARQSRATAAAGTFVMCHPCMMQQHAQHSDARGTSFRSLCCWTASACRCGASQPLVNAGSCCRCCSSTSSTTSRRSASEWGAHLEDRQQLLTGLLWLCRLCRCVGCVGCVSCVGCVGCVNELVGEGWIYVRAVVPGAGSVLLCTAQSSSCVHLPSVVSVQWMSIIACWACDDIDIRCTDTTLGRCAQAGLEGALCLRLQQPPAARCVHVLFVCLFVGAKLEMLVFVTNQPTTHAYTEQQGTNKHPRRELDPYPLSPPLPPSVCVMCQGVVARLRQDALSNLLLLCVHVVCLCSRDSAKSDPKPPPPPVCVCVSHVSGCHHVTQARHHWRQCWVRLWSLLRSSTG